jgi:hypothetical protein
MKPIPLPTPPVNADRQDGVDTLCDWVRRYREGEIRSFAIVGITADGTGMPSAFNCASGDQLKVLAAILVDDLMGARK